MMLLLTAFRCQTFILLGAALYPSKSAHIFFFIMHWGYHQLPFTYPSSPCNRKLRLSNALPLVEFSSLVGGLWFTRFSLSWSVRADMKRKFSRCVWRCSVEPSNLNDTVRVWCTRSSWQRLNLWNVILICQNEKLLSLIVISYTWWCFRYALQTDNLLKYIKIAAQLQDKTVRDVALRCRWMTVSGLITP